MKKAIVLVSAALLGVFPCLAQHWVDADEPKEMVGTLETKMNDFNLSVPFFSQRDVNKDKIKLKKTYFALAKLLILPLFFMACASTKIGSAKGSDFHLSKYNNVLIFGNFDNYKKDNALYRDMLESEVERRLSLNKIKTYKSLEVPNFIDFKSGNSEFYDFLNNNDVELLLDIAIPSCSASFDRKLVKMKTKFDITAFDAKSKKNLFECSVVITEKGADLSDCMNNTFKSLSKKLLRI